MSSHSLNNSPSHQRFSFPKQQRFAYIKPTTDVYYLPKIDRDRRSALIGYGERSLSNISAKYTANTPHAYSIHVGSINLKRGVSFTSGRHEIGGPLESIKYNKQYPSPSNYNIESSLEKKGPKMGSKLKDFSLKYFQSIPGPGSYVIPSTVDGADGNNKKIFQSRYSSGGSYRIGDLHRSQIMHRQNIEKFEIPGPGQYNIQKYGLSNPQNPFQKNSSVRFTRQKRSSMHKKGAEKIPGPGQQQIYVNRQQNIFIVRLILITLLVTISVYW